MLFKDENIIVIELGSFTTRAVIGLSESMTPPTIRVLTRIGVKRPSNTSMNDVKPKPEYLFGDELEEAVQSKDPAIEVIWPVVKGVVTDWEAMEIFWY